MALERGEDFRAAIAERAVSGAEEVLGVLRGLVVRSPVEGEGDGMEGRGDNGGNSEGGGREEEGVVDWDLLVSYYCEFLWKKGLMNNRCRIR